MSVAIRPRPPNLLAHAVDRLRLPAVSAEHLRVEAVVGAEQARAPGRARRFSSRAQRGAELEIGDGGIADRRIGARSSVAAHGAVREHEIAELRGGIAIAVPMRRKLRTPRSNSSCSTIAAIGPPMPKADAVMRWPARTPVTVRRPRFSSTKLRRFEMFGDPVDAGAVADQNRGLADLVLAAADVPGAS